MMDRRRRVLGFILSMLCCSGGVGCVAQEPYHPPSSDGATSGTSAMVVPGGGPSLGGTAGVPEGGQGGDEPSQPDPGSGAACLSSDQCGPPYPYCEPKLGRCVECLSYRNCSGSSRPFCTPSFECAACLDDAQCTKAAPYCAQTLGQCVECQSTTNCGTSGLICDRLNFWCVPACASNDDCASASSTPFCDPNRSLCVSCVSDDDCTSVAPRCKPTAKTCVACLDDGDCSGSKPRCDVRVSVCRQCLSNVDCPTGATCVAGVCANPK